MIAFGIIGVFLVVLIILIINQMEQNKTSAKDFFFHLGAMVALYVVVGTFLNLIFSIINHAYPDTNYYSYYYGGGPEISFAVATLIVVFPILLLLSWINHRSYESDPMKRGLPIRKWLTYLTLFVAGAVLAGDLVSVLYKFLDGQDLTVAFLLKAFSVLVVAGLVFGFYFQDIRDRISKSKEKVWAVGTAAILLVSIVLGFAVIGSPRTQRILRLDEQKITDLQNIQWQVINYWQVNGFIPNEMPNLPNDPQNSDLYEYRDTGYEYRKTGDLSFELCAGFNREKSVPQNQRMVGEGPYFKGGMNQNDNWDHPAGWYCFPREIDPIAYPTSVRG